MLPALLLLRIGLLLVMCRANFAASAVPGAPENITVTFLTPSSVQVSWAVVADGADKYDVMYKPTDARYYRVITIVAGNLGGAALQNLIPGTQYQLAVTAVRAGRKMRSRPIVFRTLGKPAWQQQHEQESQQRHHRHRGAESPPRIGHQEALGTGTVQVRGVEVGIVLVVLLVWAAAIALFFNRWGKIRMLLPYQPDYKEQLKAAAVAAPPPAHVPGQSCTQHLHWSRLAAGSRFDCSMVGLSPAHHRPRLNSVFAYGAPAEQLHFAPVCRKALSAENLPLAGPAPNSDSHSGCGGRHERSLEHSRSLQQQHTIVLEPAERTRTLQHQQTIVLEPAERSHTLQHQQTIVIEPEHALPRQQTIVLEPEHSHTLPHQQTIVLEPAAAERSHELSRSLQHQQTIVLEPATERSNKEHSRTLQHQKTIVLDNV